MISCFFHNRAIRRRFDDGQPLSESTTAHIEACAECRDFVATHSAVVNGLAMRPAEIDPPPFLHGRVMNTLREGPAPARHIPKWQWAVATSAVALITISIAVLPQKPSNEPSPSWPELDTEITWTPSLPQNPLESEINSLRADTLNAAKALASSFLPASEDSK